MRLCSVSMEPHYALVSWVATHMFRARELGLSVCRYRRKRKKSMINISLSHLQFADAACGDVTVMLNGSIETPFNKTRLGN